MPTLRKTRGCDGKKYDIEMLPIVWTSLKHKFIKIPKISTDLIQEWRTRRDPMMLYFSSNGVLVACQWRLHRGEKFPKMYLEEFYQKASGEVYDWDSEGT